MRTRVSILIAVIAGALIGGLAVGVSVYYWTGAVETSVVWRQETTSTSTEKPDSTTVASRPSIEGVMPDLSPYAHVQTIQDIAQLESDFDRNISLYLLLANADRDALETYIRQSISLSSANHRNTVLSVIFGRYAALDPQIAVDQALAIIQLTLDERDALVKAIFNEWAIADLNAAAIAVDELPQSFKFHAANAVMRRSDDLTTQQREALAQRIGPSEVWIAMTIKNIALEAIKAEPRNAYYERIRESSHNIEFQSDLLGIAHHWFALDGPVVLREIYESTDNQKTRRFLVNNLIINSLFSNSAKPSDLLNVVSAFPNKRDARESVESVFSNWSQSEPRASFEASFDYDDVLTDDFRSSLIKTWASKDPSGLLAEVSSLPTEYRDTAVVNALGRMARDDPDEAIRRARNLDSRALQMSARDEIIQSWSWVNAKDAFEWLMNDSFNENSRNNRSNWQAAFSAYLEQDFESAQQFANQYKGEIKNQLVESVVRYMIRWDLDRAIDYLANVDVDSRLTLQEQIGSKLLETNPREALDFVATIEESHQNKVYQSVLAQWAFSDSISLFDNLEQLPDEYQQVAATQILFFSGQLDSLTDRQIKKLESMVGTDESQ